MSIDDRYPNPDLVLRPIGTVRLLRLPHLIRRPRRVPAPATCPCTPYGTG